MKKQRLFTYHLNDVRAQTASEYLIVIAVVIIIALVVVGSLRTIISSGSRGDEQSSKLQLISGQIGVDQVTTSWTSTTFLVRNNVGRTIILTSAMANHTACALSSPITLPVGKTHRIICPAVDIISGVSAEIEFIFNYTDVSTQATYTYVPLTTWPAVIDDTPNTLTENLIAYYPFDGDANDHSGNGLDGSWTEGDANYTLGLRSRLAADFNGVDNAITIADDPLLNPEENLTVSFWFKMRSNSWYWGIQPVNKKATDWSDWGSWVFVFNKAPQRGNMHVYGNGCGFTPHSLLLDEDWNNAPSVSYDEWYHVVLTANSSAYRYYFNGQLWYEETALYDGICPDLLLEYPIYVGWEADSGHYDGLIQDLAIWSKALSASEVDTLYNDGLGVKIK